MKPKHLSDKFKVLILTEGKWIVKKGVDYIEIPDVENSIMNKQSELKVGKDFIAIEGLKLY